MYIRIDLKIILFLIIFFITNQLEIYLLFMLFTILHELGHLAAGIILGFRPKGIKIFPIGLAISFKVNCDNYNSNIKNAKIITLKKLLIAIFGPLTNFIISAFFIMFNVSFFGFSRENIIYANILIGIFNLIPIYPLDGGRIVKNLIHINKSLKISYKYTNFISNVSLIFLTIIASIAILYFKNIAILIMIGYLWLLVIRENKIYNKKMNLYELVDNIVMKCYSSGGHPY